MGGKGSVVLFRSYSLNLTKVRACMCVGVHVLEKVWGHLCGAYGLQGCRQPQTCS